MTLAVHRPRNSGAAGMHASAKEGSPLAEAKLLTPDEKAIFERLLKSDAEIAQELQIGENVAKYHRQRVVGKLNAATRDEVAVRARDWDLAVSRLLGE